MDRRDFIKTTVAAELALVTGMSLEGCAKAEPGDFLKFDPVGKLTIMFICDSHAHLRPVYYREPSVNLAPQNMADTPGHLGGEKIFDYWGVKPKTKNAYFLGNIDFTELANKYGKMGGFSHLATLAEQIRTERDKENCLFLDAGDTWQGSGIGLFTKGEAVVEAQKILGVDVLTPHWEFTYGKEVLDKNVKELEKSGCTFLAQNVEWDPGSITAMENGDEGRVFKPYTIKERAGVKIGIIGQGFPYVPIAHPKHLKDYNIDDEISADWTFGIRHEAIQELVDELRNEKKVDLVVLLSHNGLEVDKKVAKVVKGIDILVGGHTHDPVPKALEIKGDKTVIQKDFKPQSLQIGGTLLVQAGSHGKFLGRIDLDIKDKKIVQYSHKLIPVLSNVIKPHNAMQTHIDAAHKPYEQKLGEKLAVTENILYRRDTMCGTFDRLIVEAIQDEYDSEVVFSPGFRWGPSILPGDEITMKDVYDLTAVTYSWVWTFDTKGSALKLILADILDNVFNPDPFKQQGGDFSRLYGVDLTLKIDIPAGAAIDERIVAMKIGGKDVEPERNYKMSIWGGTTDPNLVTNLRANPRPVYDVVADYLRKKKKVNVPVPDYVKYVK